ncbi:MAG: colicin V production protein [Dehalococcoidia bacterium]|nr:colicin V production protein [Dehalococcoidia bacterium]
MTDPAGECLGRERMNEVDLVVVAGVALYALAVSGRGVLPLLSDLLVLTVSFLVALRFYAPVASWLVDHTALAPSFSNALGFLGVLLFAEVLLDIAAARLHMRLPERWRGSPYDRWLAVIPAAVHGGLLAMLVLLLLVGLPVSPAVKDAIEESPTGHTLVEQAARIERALAPVFGAAIQDTLTFLTVQNESGERVSIPARTEGLQVDREAEERMLALVNEERTSRGLAPLVLDPTIVPVARAHSRDMWERGYFAHLNPDGDDPFDRMRAGGVSFLAAGENLALAPTTERAHEGLMNSPGHRRNILDPDFGRVGIGVIDAGLRGKMFTQNFAD